MTAELLTLLRPVHYGRALEFSRYPANSLAFFIFFYVLLLCFIAALASLILHPFYLLVQFFVEEATLRARDVVPRTRHAFISIVLAYSLIHRCLAVWLKQWFVQGRLMCQILHARRRNKRWQRANL